MELFGTPFSKHGDILWPLGMKKKAAKVFYNLSAVSALQDGDRETGAEGISILGVDEVICRDIVLQRELTSEIIELVLLRRLPRWESHIYAKTPRAPQRCLQIRYDSPNKTIRFSTTQDFKVRKMEKP
jgi:hypothetical protein